MARGRNPLISDKAIKDMRNSNLTNQEIMEKVGCSYGSIYNALKRNELLKEKGRPKTIDNNKVIELHDKGYEPKEIAIEVGCSVDPIYKLIRKYKDNG